ncbi:hypothetical protein P9850_01805 [Anoxybacillus rupiensis]|uniref:Uncharacterized protein n=1 Tax=Anoxybacteroides rupiense TaxID=311460 RepID=A0ABD5IS01_9BACL|nr:hypothetical protein [Anoxybacillus rupiensis]
MLKKGDKVVMHTCIEAERHNGRIWTCKTDEFERNGQRLVFLEGFTGCFSAEYLQRVDLSDVYFANAVIKGTLDDYSEKIEELQEELERWESGLNQIKEMYELQRQLRQAHEEIERLRDIEYDLNQKLQDIEYDLNKKLQEEQWNFLECNRERNKYKQQFEQAQAKVERIKECINKKHYTTERYDRVVSVEDLEKALEGTEQ